MILLCFFSVLLSLQVLIGKPGPAKQPELTTHEMHKCAILNSCGNRLDSSALNLALPVGCFVDKI